MTGWGQGGEGLRSQSFIGRQMSHVEKKKEEYNWRGTGGKGRNIWDYEESEAREEKWHKGFILLWPLWFHFWGWPCKCHVGNLGYKSKLKLTTKPVAVPSPSQPSLRSLTAAPSSAKLSLTTMFDMLSKEGQNNPTTNFLVCRKFFECSPGSLSLSLMCLYKWCYIVRPSVSKLKIQSMNCNLQGQYAKNSDGRADES